MPKKRRPWINKLNTGIITSNETQWSQRSLVIKLISNLELIFTLLKFGQWRSINALARIDLNFERLLKPVVDAGISYEKRLFLHHWLVSSVQMVVARRKKDDFFCPTSFLRCWIPKLLQCSMDAIACSTKSSCYKRLSPRILRSRRLGQKQEKD